MPQQVLAAHAIRPAAQEASAVPVAPLALVRAGVVSGLLAGAVFAVHLALVAEVAAQPTSAPGIRSSTWTPFTGIASFVFGGHALHGSLWPGYVAVGLALHLLVAAVAGVAGTWWVYVCLGRPDAPALAAALGIAFGLLVETVALQFLINPLQSPNVVYESLPTWGWWAGHVVYGAALGLFAARRLVRAP